MDDDKFYPLSDKAQVEFDIPDDYNDYNQEPSEIVNLLNSIVDAVRKRKMTLMLSMTRTGITHPPIRPTKGLEAYGYKSCFPVPAPIPPVDEPDGEPTNPD